MIRRELDFGHEARRLKQFASYFDGDPRVRIPQVHDDLTTGRVLTTEWLEGPQGLRSGNPRIGGDRPAEARRNGAAVFLEMIFDHGVYHADPHPGNLMVHARRGNVLGLIDFGMVGRLERTRCAKTSKTC